MSSKEIIAYFGSFCIALQCIKKYKLGTTIKLESNPKLLNGSVAKAVANEHLAKYCILYPLHQMEVVIIPQIPEAS